MNALSKLFGWAAVFVGLLYVIALGLWAIGTRGLFGQPQDPLSGVFLIPLGLPWNEYADGPEIGIIAPVINIVILWLLSSLLKRKP